MSSKINRVIEKITLNYPKEIKVSDLLFDGIEEKELFLILQFLDLFNPFEFKSKKIELKSTIKIKSEFANTFLKSLNIYIKNNYKIIRYWENNSTTQNLDPCLYLNQGINLTYSLEHQRYNYYEDETPSRSIKVSIAIIKTKPENKKDEYYLVQYDADAQTYKFIGGKKIPEDNSPETTLIRKIEEKLPVNKLVFKRDYNLKPILSNIKTIYLSHTHAAISEYRFDIFEMEVKKDLKLTPAERWVTLDEISKGVTHDNIVIGNSVFYNMLNNSIPGGLKSIKPSFQYNNEFVKNLKLPLTDEIKLGESKKLEFKSSARWDYKTNKINTQLLEVIAKSISGFMNMEGGKLLIGVKDNKEILGIKKDIETLKVKNTDGFSLLLNQIVESYLGIEMTELIDINYKKISGKTICIVEIKESTKPVFIKIDNNKFFYVRMGNSTKKLDSEESYNFIRYHW